MILILNHLKYDFTQHCMAIYCSSAAVFCF